MTDEERLDAILKKVNEIWQGLYGIPDTEETGLCGKLEELAREHNKLSNNFRLLIGVLAGSGILGGLAAGLFKLLG